MGGGERDEIEEGRSCNNNRGSVGVIRVWRPPALFLPPTINKEPSLPSADGLTRQPPNVSSRQCLRNVCFDTNLASKPCDSNRHKSQVTSHRCPRSTFTHSHMPSAGRGRGNWPNRFQRAAAGESLNESEKSTTSASQFYLTVARPSTPTEAEAASAADDAGQVLSDVVKALDGQVIPLPVRLGLWDPAHGARQRSRTSDGQQEPRWRTAGLAYPCSCEWQGEVNCHHVS